MTAERISAAHARRACLVAQGVLGRARRPRTVGDVVGQLSALQLDTISVLARSHELVCYSRLGPIGRNAIEKTVGHRGADGWPTTIEYWAHAACIMPVGLWPWLAFRRRRFRQRARWHLAAPEEALAHVRARLAADGPLTATELGGAKRGGPWWDWSPVKMAVELLLDWGDVVCVTRRGWKRVYDLAERALPPDVVNAEPDDEACLAHLVATAAASLGVATAADLAEYFRLTRHDVALGLPGSGLIPLEVDGWAQPAWAAPGALDAATARGRHRTTLLSPFDSLVWDRPRSLRLFGFTHRIEAYTPSPERVHGYYAMPLLAGGRLVGRVDPGRDGRSLVAKQASVSHAAAIPALADALVEAAAWVGADTVAVDKLDPPSLRGALLAALP